MADGAHIQLPEDALCSALRERGQRVTPQRLTIARVVRELDRHVTAEQVLTAVSDRLPGVSLPTVYATLELLEELGSVRRVSAGGGAVLYDPRTHPHHHVVCTRCGAVADIDAPLDDEAVITAARDAGFEPERADTVVHGICMACRS
ncbi:Fur family transcriptional regulator [Capillimicrobium parvum]|uniref:Peroxide-responsive repressor PerR n=1 Tax=Capillimicrobium parvum TaxID=2884022 RepID=A0A9E6Y020_9ACTN|nr:Fur family transcriptional regulator [Capillimicrobium parvum]UGS37147.1 Peroxide-responsive repressor PerR [Capillimicrobium parvum]